MEIITNRYRRETGLSAYKHNWFGKRIHNQAYIDWLEKQCTINGVVKSLPTKEIKDYLEMSEDFYIDDSEIANRFYNAALNDVKYFIEKEEEKLK